MPKDSKSQNPKYELCKKIQKVENLTMNFLSPFLPFPSLIFTIKKKLILSYNNFESISTIITKYKTQKTCFFAIFPR